MGKRGPKPKPTAQRIREGNPSNRPLNDTEPEYQTDMPDCPEHLGPEARKEWDRLATILVVAGTITVVDRAILAAYCEAWGLMVQASRDVQEHGSACVGSKGALYSSPYMSNLSAAMKQVKALAAELGLTPSSRSQVHATKPPAAEGVERLLKVVG